MASQKDYSNFEFLTEKDFREIFGEAASELLKENTFSWGNSLLLIEQMCDFFLKAATNSKLTGLVNEEQLYMLGFKLVFSLREFLLKEEIIFSIGATDPQNNTLSTTELHSKDLWENIHVNLKEQIIALNSDVEKFNPSKVNKRRSDMWKKVLQYGIHYVYRDDIYDKIPTRSGKGKRKIYRSFDPDTNVYIGFSGQKGDKYLWYYKKSNGYLNYNRGWLYEWFMSYVMNQHMAIMEQSLRQPNYQLEGMMNSASRENISGFRGGDYIARGRQYQAKMNNMQITTFNNIITTIQNIQKIIQEYKEDNDGNSKDASAKLANSFMQIFTHKETLNRSYGSYVNSILEQLKLKK